MVQTALIQALSPTQYFFQGIQKLTINSELGDLPAFDVVVTPGTPGQRVAALLEKDVHLPGVLVMDGEILQGVISRETFYERTGKLFGTDVYLGRPISRMLETIPYPHLVLPESMLITLATQKALNRELSSIYDPIVVESPGKYYRLLSALMLFIAQSQQLLELHHQRAYTVDSGQALSDREAILNFIKHVGNRPEFIPDAFTRRQAVRCDHCMKIVNYAIVDVVRSFPQLNRGVIVEEKMGNRSYRLYVRHKCLNGEIWEIAMQLDEKLEYRSQRSARAVESYV